MDLVEARHPEVPVTAACDALGVSRASLYRRRQPPEPKAPPAPRPPSSRRLSDPERQALLDVLHSDEFIDQPPREVYATLLGRGIYLASIRTMYRVLAEAGECRERRHQRTPHVHPKPRLTATEPNQVWTWDITKLATTRKGVFLSLYVILDLFSRYVVGWMVAHRESAALARRLIETACRNQSIEPGQLTIHADRGASMRSKSLALLLADLGVAKTHSRPHVSNDNPYSESQFKTLKYCPQFPERFGSIQDARAFGGPFFDYYNNEHRHSGIGLMTPAAVHYGMAKQLTAARQETLLAAYRSHPERFVHRPPQPPELPRAAWINPPAEKTTPQDRSESTIVTPGNPWDPPSGADCPAIIAASITTSTSSPASTPEVAH